MNRFSGFSIFFLVLLSQVSFLEGDDSHRWLAPESLRKGEVPFYNRRLEPFGRRVIHGAGQAKEPFMQYFESMGDSLQPLSHMCYFPLLPPEQMKARIGTQGFGQRREYPVRTIAQQGMSIKKWKLADSTEILQSVRHYVTIIRQMDQPMFLRIGYEFNGEWNRYEPETYKYIFRAVTTELRKQGLDSVATLWCYAPEGEDRDYMKWYPGDDVVDWWSIDLFSPEQLTSGATRTFLNHAREKRYPVFIGESSPRWVGARQGMVSWRSWFYPYLKLMARYKNIKGFSLIVYDWQEHYENPKSFLHDWGDARLWKDSVVHAKWSASLQNSVFIHFKERDQLKNVLNFTISRSEDVSTTDSNRIEFRR